jgi:hypothetical protein
MISRVELMSFKKIDIQAKLEWCEIHGQNYPDNDTNIQLLKARLLELEKKELSKERLRDLWIFKDADEAQQYAKGNIEPEKNMEHANRAEEGEPLNLCKERTTKPPIQQAVGICEKTIYAGDMVSVSANGGLIPLKLNY